MASRKETPGEFLKNSVPPVGPDDPTFAVWAEAPAHYEMKDGQPLVGPSGKLFNRVLFKLGVRRRYVRLDNFCRTRLPRDNEEYLWKVTTKGRFKTHVDWDQLVDRMRADIRRMPCKLIVLLGATPLVGLMGPEYRNIDSYRGYPFEWEDKLIMPTTHPARCMPGRSPHFFWIIYADILKGMRIASNGRDVKPMQVYIPGRKWEEITL